MGVALKDSIQRLRMSPYCSLMTVVGTERKVFTFVPCPLTSGSDSRMGLKVDFLLKVLAGIIAGFCCTTAESAIAVHASSPWASFLHHLPPSWSAGGARLTPCVIQQMPTTVYLHDWPYLRCLSYVCPTVPHSAHKSVLCICEDLGFKPFFRSTC